jgi:hypothetical protein
MHTECLWRNLLETFRAVDREEGGKITLTGATAIGYEDGKWMELAQGHAIWRAFFFFSGVQLSDLTKSLDEKVEGKVFPVLLTEHHAMKAYWGGEV